MATLDKITPTEYGLGAGRLVIRGKTVATLEINLQVTLYNASGGRIDTLFMPLTFTDPEKQAIVDKVSSKLTDFENETGLVRRVE
jgi:hypothetical protein